MKRRIRKRYEAVISLLPAMRATPALALRASLKQGYTFKTGRDDLLAGLVVGVVALPLSMALAIASGVRPENGLYTAIVAGAIIALLGGSKVQVSGPTAAFVVILAPVAGQFGLAGLALASVFAGIILLLMGLLRMGRFIEFIPYPVTTGFTAGIAVVIATLQVKDLFGLTVAKMPDHYIEKVEALSAAAWDKFAGAGFSWLSCSDIAVGLLTLVILVLLPRLTRKVPAPLVALPVATVVAYLATKYIPGFEVATIQSKFASPSAPLGIPQQLPHFVLPWTEPGPGGGALKFDTGVIRSLISTAFAIAMLGAIESLLSAVVADGMTGKKHDPDTELFAQGVGNIVAPFFGGFAATGAIARTATNIRSGGKTPLASFIHALFLFGVVYLVATSPSIAAALTALPMASMAALLIVVARNMAEVKHVAFLLRFAPRSDVAVLLTCFSLTVIFDMVIAVSAGFTLAAILFMRRMTEVSKVRLVGEEHQAFNQPVPKEVLLYEIAGPLFFGAAAKALSSLDHLGQGCKVVILDLEPVPVIDATGLVNFDSLISRLERKGVFIVLAGVQDQPMRVFEKAGWMAEPVKVIIAGNVEGAIEIARAFLDDAAN